MKKIVSLIYLLSIWLLISCNPQEDPISDIGNPPTSASINIDDSDPYHPVFNVTASDAFIFHWEIGDFTEMDGQEVEPYLPFQGDYEIICHVYGAGGEGIVVSTSYHVTSNDPAINDMPVWAELTGHGTGRTWEYNTDHTTGIPDYCYQTGNSEELENEPDSWMPDWSWGQCVQITPDINGTMVFDLNGGLNYTYHHIAGDAGVQGTFSLDTDNMTITIVDPYILDHDIECTNPEVTVNGTYRIMLLTDEEMVLWQDQEDEEETGWAWSFRVKN